MTNAVLISSLVALLLGPLLFQALSKSRQAISFLEGFIFVSITGLVLGAVTLDIDGAAGVWVILALLVGFLGPSLLERLLSRSAKNVHLLTLFLSVFGLVLHAALDGVALLLTELKPDNPLPYAVVLHRLPVALTLWWLIVPSFGRKVGWGTIILMCLATLLGFFSGEDLMYGERIQGVIPIIEALVAGALLHVVVFRFHIEAHDTEDHCCSHEPKSSSQRVPTFEAIGNLLGAALVIILLAGGGPAHLEHSHEQFDSYPSSEGTQIVSSFLNFALETAPALLLAHILAVFVYGFLPQSSVRWISKGSNLKRAAKGVVVGLPLPICSCGVLPYYQTLVRKGVPPAAALAFLIATPELGIDAVLISFPLLGLDMTLIRVVAAAILAFAVAGLVAPYIKAAKASEETETVETLPAKEKFYKGLRHSFIDLADDTSPWIVLGLLLAAVLSPVLVDYNFSGPTFLEVIIFAAIGVVVYVCAAGATPLVAVLLIHGVSPGAALAFLLTGPATNISTFGVLSQLHGRRSAMLFALGTLALSVILGLLVNALFAGEISTPLSEHHLHGEDYSLYRWLALGALALIYLASVLRQGARNYVSTLFVSAH